MKNKFQATLVSWACACVCSTQVFAQISSQSLPTAGTVSAGSASISQAGATMQINQTSNKAIIDWQSFNIGRDAAVRFNQPSSSAVVLNRVGVGGGRSIIDGALSSNGQVWLLNPDGVLFSNTARVDVGGLLASTMQIGNTYFMQGNYRFTKNGTSSIVNQGELKAAPGGYIALLAPEVRNEGVITARLGTVAMATGEEMRVDFTGDRLIEVQVDKATVEGLIDNNNLIEAEGGWVFMSTDAANRLAHGAINNTGIVRATTVAEHEGVIKLLGGVTTVGGTLDASAPNGGDGGFIEASGHKVNLDPAVQITTLASAGKTGLFLLDPNDYTIAATGGDITGAALGSLLATNNFEILTASMGTSGGSGNIYVNDNVSWASNNYLLLNAQNNVLIGADINSTSASGMLKITAGNDITDTGGKFITSNKMVVRAGGNVELSNAAHTVANLSALLTGQAKYFKFKAAQAMTVTSVDGINGITTANGSITINQNLGDLTVNNNITAGTGLVSIKLNQTNTLLTISSTATIDSSNSSQYYFDGANACGLSVAICLSAGRMDISGNVSAANQAVLLEAGGSRVIAVGGSDVNAADNGGGVLGISNQELTKISAKMLGISNAISGGAARNITIDDVVNLSAVQNLGLRTEGNINFNAPVTMQGGIYLKTPVSSTNLIQQTSANPISAAFMVIQGGVVYLSDAANNVGTIASNVSNNAFNFRNGGRALTVGSLAWVDASATSIAGINAGNITIYSGSDLTLNAALTANTSTNVPIINSSTIYQDCLLAAGGGCKKPHVDLRAGNAFTNNVGSSVINMSSPSIMFWSIKSKMPALTKLNGLVAGATTFDGSNFSGEVLINQNRIFYGQKDPATAQTATVVAETTVSKSASDTAAGSTTTTSQPVALAPAGGLGSGGATMTNFNTAKTSSTPSPTSRPASTSSATASSNTNSSSTSTTSSTQGDASVKSEASTETKTGERQEAAGSTTAALEKPEPSAPPKLIVDAAKAIPKQAGVLSRAELEALSKQVSEARAKIFSDAVSTLESDPTIADISDCGKSGGGLCIAQPIVPIRQEAYLPIVKRKVALLIGNNAYASPIPALETAVNDVNAIANELVANLGYEVKVIENAGQEQIVNALNDLIRNTNRDDSVMVMYAGHGYLQEKNNTGYWIPSDASPTKPDKWISNDTISRALGNIPAKQVMLVSDSCYSGSLTKEGKVIENVAISREQTLTRRTVTALSSGGEEPVTDEGRDNHSIFAWNLIQSLKQMKEETSGKQLHASIKDAVTKEFPQVPQYGTVMSAGHAEGGEYLFTPAQRGVR